MAAQASTSSGSKMRKRRFISRVPIRGRRQHSSQGRPARSSTRLSREQPLCSCSLQRLGGLGDHGFKDAQAALADKATPHAPGAIDNHSGGEFSPIKTAADRAGWIQQHGVINALRRDGAAHLLLNLLKRFADAVLLRLADWVVITRSGQPIQRYANYPDFITEFSM